MSYYTVVVWNKATSPIQTNPDYNKFLNTLGIDTTGEDFFINIPDNKFTYHLHILMKHFDVMFTERHGKIYIKLDDKHQSFQANPELEYNRE